jgi:hypothetical protein
MKYLKLFTALVVILNFNNCSTMSVNKQAANLSSITVNKTYQLRVRSGNLAMDKLIYEFASAELGKYLRMNNKEPVNSFIDIEFLSKSKRAFAGINAGYVNNVFYGNSWYTGSETPGLSNAYRSAGTEITPGGSFTWQNSTMLVTIQDMESRILWKAHYNYKGGSEFAWVYVNTADEAARISLNKIIKQFEKDFIIIPKAEDKIKYEKPGIALIVEKQKAPGSQHDNVTEEAVPDEK